MRRWRWLLAAVLAAVAATTAFALARSPGAQVAAHSQGQHQRQATSTRERPTKPKHGSKAVDCEIASVAYVKGIVLVDRACVRSKSTTLEYTVTAAHIKNTTRALAAACDAYVGTAADHQWVGTYVVPPVRRELQAAGGRCADWLALASRQPPAGAVHVHTSSAALYSGS